MSNCRCWIEYQNKRYSIRDSSKWCYRPCTPCDMKRIRCSISKVNCSSRSYSCSGSSFDNARNFDHILSSEDRKLTRASNCYSIDFHNSKIICLAVKRYGFISFQNNTCISNNWCSCVECNRKRTCVLYNDERYYWSRSKNFRARCSNRDFKSCHSRRKLIYYSV